MAKDIFEKCYDFFAQPQMVKSLGAYPFFTAIEESDGPRIKLNGKTLVMAVSNNYLGLTNHPKVKEAAAKALRHGGSSCSGSRLVNGNLELHEELERRLAKALGKPEALIFATGYMTNLGTIGCLFDKDQVIFSDSENHASIIDGCRQSRGTVACYEHNDIADCREKIATTDWSAGGAIVTDGVFSMTGVLAKLPELVAIKKENPGMRLYVDDAHGFGVFGAHGLGTAEHFGCSDDVDIIMGTFSKSLASIGGFIATEPEVIEYIRHKARPLWFSAGAAPASTAAALAALDVIQTEPQHREKLWENVKYAREGLERIGVYLLPSDAPILSIWVGAEGTAMKFAMALRDEGVFATPVAHPAVPYGHALIRTSYMASHSKEDIAIILEAFQKLAVKFKIRKCDLAVEDPRTLPPADYYNLEALF